MNVENPRTEKHVGGKAETQIEDIALDEIFSALREMKKGKAVGPGDIPVEAWKVLIIARSQIIARNLPKYYKLRKIPNEWRNSTIIPIFNNKGDIQGYNNYRGIKLMSHTLEMWEKI